MWSRAVLEGMWAGLVGAMVMTTAERFEQRWTGRPGSYVPARTLERLTGLPEQQGRQAVAVNLAMHLGQGALLGVC